MVFSWAKKSVGQNTLYGQMTQVNLHLLLGPTGAISASLDRISIRETTIADAFKSGGYATGCVGKWHNVTLMRDPIPERIIPDPTAPELYNIDDDPLEQKNIATDHPGRVSRMLTELETWFEEVESERLSIPKEW